MTVYEISILDLLACAVAMAIPYFISRFLKLGLERDLLVGSIRVFLQLLAVGYILDRIFAVNHAAPVFGILLVMTANAGFNAAKRAELAHARTILMATGVIGVTTLAVCAFVFYAVIGIEPYFNPRYVIPMMGMGLNGAMNAVAIGARALDIGVRDNRERIEAALCVGATSQQAVAPIVRDSLRQALIPAINGLMTAGIVQLPGFMTGQITGGVDPQIAVRYQVVIFYMLTGIVALSSITAILLLVRRYFTPDHQLREFAAR